MDKNIAKKLSRGKKRGDLIANRPFAIALHTILRERGLPNSALDRMAGLGNGVIGKILKSGNPTLDTAWAIEDALELPRGALCAPAATPSHQAGKPEEAPTVVLKSATASKNMPLSNALLPRNIDDEKPEQRFPAIGKAAAKDGFNGTHGGFSEGQYVVWDDITIPVTTHFIQVSGDSMDPMILNGQYAMIGPQYFGDHNQPRSREIVIVHVSIVDEEQAGTDGPWEGVYCKRIQDNGDIWLFTSINPSGESFTAAKANCQIWPVIGVWFAGNGEIPEED